MHYATWKYGLPDNSWKQTNHVFCPPFLRKKFHKDALGKYKVEEVSQDKYTTIAEMQSSLPEHGCWRSGVHPGDKLFVTDHKLPP